METSTINRSDSKYVWSQVPDVTPRHVNASSALVILLAHVIFVSILDGTVLHCTALYCIVLYCTVLQCVVLSFSL
jgi:hypothetical protein